MGITGYYRRFIEGFSRIANPITSLQKKGKKFEWNQKCEEIFKKVKTLLTTTPILRIVDPNKDFVICTDACNDGICGILTQEGHVITNESRKLKIHEKNYATYDRVGFHHTCFEDVAPSLNRNKICVNDK